MKENTVIMMGRIQKPPFIKVNKNGEYVVGRIELLTVRRTKANEELRLLGTPRLDTQYIISRNPVIIEKRMVPLKEGDIVILKGNMATRNTSKRYICPFCGGANVYEGTTLIYIDPIFLEKTSHEFETEEEAKESLLGKAEISNNIIVAGNVCREPVYYKSPDGRKEECDFQLAVGRKRRIIEDGPEKTTDFPFVKTYGKNSFEYSQVLQLGSEVLINGSVQAREIEMLKQCEFCNEEFVAQGATMEIVPYSVEYIENCNIPVYKEEEKLEEDDIKENEDDFEELGDDLMIDEENLDKEFMEDSYDNAYDDSDFRNDSWLTDDYGPDEYNLDDYDEDEEGE